MANRPQRGSWPTVYILACMLGYLKFLWRKPQPQVTVNSPEVGHLTIVRQ